MCIRDRTIIALGKLLAQHLGILRTHIIETVLLERNADALFKLLSLIHIFAFKNSRTFQMGGIFCAASFLSIMASDINDQLLKDFLDMDSSQIEMCIRDRIMAADWIPTPGIEVIGGFSSSMIF